MTEKENSSTLNNNTLYFNSKTSQVEKQAVTEEDENKQDRNTKIMEDNNENFTQKIQNNNNNNNIDNNDMTNNININKNNNTNNNVSDTASSPFTTYNSEDQTTYNSTTNNVEDFDSRIKTEENEFPADDDEDLYRIQFCIYDNQYKSENIREECQEDLLARRVDPDNREIFDYYGFSIDAKARYFPSGPDCFIRSFKEYYRIIKARIDVSRGMWATFLHQQAQMISRDKEEMNESRNRSFTSKLKFRKHQQQSKMDSDTMNSTGAEAKEFNDGSSFNIEYILSKASETEALRELTISGIPPELRGTVWFVLSGAKDIRNRRIKLLAKEEGVDLNRKNIDYSTFNYFQTLINNNIGKTNASVKSMEKDVFRTFNHHHFFRQNTGRRVLEDVLFAYIFRDGTSVGYTQSMNYIAAMLLLFMEEDEAFWMLTVTVENILRGYYGFDVHQLQVDQRVFGELLADFLPALDEHMKSVGCFLGLFCTQWFMCIFTTSFPSETCLRIWDVLFLERNCTVLFRIGLAVLDLFKDKLMQCNSAGDMLNTLNSETQVLWDPQPLIERAFYGMNIDEGYVKMLRKKYYQQVRGELEEYKMRQEIIDVQSETHFESREIKRLREEYRTFVRMRQLKRKMQSPQFRKRQNKTRLALQSEEYCEEGDDLESSEITNSAKYDEIETSDNEEEYMLEEEDFAAIIGSVFPSWRSNLFLLNRLFYVFNKNETGKISFMELASGLSVLLKGTLDEKLRMWFESFDIHKKDKLDREEVEMMVKYMCEVYYEKTPTQEKLVEFVDMLFDLDSNNDGQLSYFEVRSAILSYPILSKALMREELTDKKNTFFLSEHAVRPNWVPDNDCPRCVRCCTKFTFMIRRHHCRYCGNVFCGSCCSRRVWLSRMGYIFPKRVCFRCYRALGGDVINESTLKRNMFF